ncbi:MAG: caspase family protein [Myxococcota bacterium]
MRPRDPHARRPLTAVVTAFALALLASAAVALGAASGAARAALPPPGETRYALVVGAHAGGSGETPLAYAGRDARRVSDVLVELGGFLPDNVVTLVDPDATRMRDAFARLNARLRADRQPGRTSVLVVYYSGHADQKSLHLGDTALPWDELVNSVQGSSAELRLLVVDACRAGFATRVKGLRPEDAFTLPLVPEPAAEGMAILASATQGEDAQESDAIGASFFTHHFLAGLRGAGDANDDGQVSLEEAYRYARDQTVASTAMTAAGVQHPTYRYDFKGRANVILTSLASTSSQGSVVLPGEGRFLFHEGRGDGPLAAEVSSRAAGTRVVLPAGRYVVRWRRPERYLAGPVSVAAGRDTAVEPAGMQVFEYARLVRKGGGASAAFHFDAFVGVASPALDAFGPAPSIGLGFGLDLAPIGFDAALWYGAARSTGSGIETVDHELGLLFGVRKSFDLGRVSLGLGVRAGVVAHVEDYPPSDIHDEPTRGRVVPALEVPLRAELLLTGPWSLVLEVGARATPLEVRKDIDTVETKPWLGGFARLGVGVSF